MVDLAMGADFLADGRAEWISKAEANAIKALSLAPDEPRAHVILGAAQIATNRAAEGVAECERALALDHNFAAAHASIGLAKCYMGRARETEGHILEALRLSPRDVQSFRWMQFAGIAKLQCGDDIAAVVWLRRSIERNRNHPPSHFALAAALGLQGMLEEAQAAAKAGLALNPGFTIRRFRSLARSSNDPDYLAGFERTCGGMRVAGAPEG